MASGKLGTLREEVPSVTHYYALFSACGECRVCAKPKCFARFGGSAEMGYRELVTILPTSRESGKFASK